MINKIKISKRKKGNVILMVLMVATVLIMLSAVISSALIFTAKGNTIDKYKNDYIYAAEGGIEQGIERFKSGGTFPFDVAYLESDTINPERGIELVHVELDKTNLRDVKIISTVTANGREVAKIVLPVGKMVGISNLLKYSLAASDKVDVRVAGAINFDTVNIGANNKGDSSVIQNASVQGSDVTHNVTETNMNQPIFNITKVPGNHEFPPEGFNTFPKFRDYVLANGKNLNMDTVDLDNGLGYYKVVLDGDSKEYLIVMVNSDNLKFKDIGMEPDSDPEAEIKRTLKNIILISNKEVYIEGARVIIDRSTIYAPNIKTNLSGAYHQISAPMYGFHPSWTMEQRTKPGDEFGNGNVTKKQIAEFDDIISQYMDSYGDESDISGVLEVDYGRADYTY